MPLALLCGLFFVSGSSALIFETLWFAQAGLGFGNTVVASSLVLTAFMGGMALGGLIAARLGDHVQSGLRAYAALEACVAVSGVVLTLALPRVHGILAPLAGGGAPFLLGAARFVLSCALLLVPSTAIGMTLPLLAREGGARDANFGRVLGLLYGVNTLGAVAGAVLCETVLVGALGITGTAAVAGALSLGAAVAALALSLSTGWAPAAPATTVGGLAPAPPSRASIPWLATGALSGFLLLALEVVWLRVLEVFLNDTPLAFAMVLALVLAGVGGGSLLASAWASRSPHPEVAAPFVAYGAGAAGVGGYLLYPGVLERTIASHQDAGVVLHVALPLVLPTSLASGALFTLVGAGLRREAPTDAVATGRLAFANTLGAGLGSLGAGFVLLPRLGMERSLFALLALYGAAGLLLSSRITQSPRVRFGVPAAFVVCLLAFPFGFIHREYIRASAGRWMNAGDTVEHVREGTTATIVHVVHRKGGRPVHDQVATNAYSMTTNDFIARRYMKLFVALPAAIHPKLERALVIGYGIGNTVEALLETPDVKRVDVADVSRELLDVSRHMLARDRAHLLDDPRVAVHIEDGRFFLQATEPRYDLITGEPPPPVVAGVVSLYTREYFELMRTRLAPGGMVTYWLPMMDISRDTALSIISGFCAAFPDCSLWHGAAMNFMLAGSLDARGPVSADHVSRPFADARRRAELASIGLERPEQLGALFIGDARYLNALTRGVPPVEDAFPKRIQQPGSRAERDALVAQFRDANAARARFQESELVRAWWPDALREPASASFDAQRLIDDLLYPDSGVTRSTRLLHQLLLGTQLTFPTLLLLRSNPDVQRLLASLSPAERDKEEWLPHVVAAHLAARDFAGALAAIERTPAALLPMPDLPGYVAYAAQRIAKRDAN